MMIENDFSRLRISKVRHLVQVIDVATIVGRYTHISWPVNFASLARLFSLFREKSSLPRAFVLSFEGPPEVSERSWECFDQA